jgi:phosphomannomutase
LTTTRMIDKLAAGYGRKCYVTPVGFKFIVEKMLAGGILMGGEESGGIGVTQNMPERDAILMGLLLLEAVVMSGKTLGGLVQEVFDDVGPHCYHRIDAHFRRDQMTKLTDVVAGLAPSDVHGFGVTETNRTDGVLFELEGGRFLMLRGSGTEPVVRIYAEAESMDAAEKIASVGEMMLRDAID